MKRRTRADVCRQTMSAAAVAPACCAALAAAEPAGQATRDASVQSVAVKPFLLDLRTYDFSRAPKVKPWRVVPLRSEFNFSSY